MALTEDEKIFLQGVQRENPSITPDEMSVELNELRKETGTAATQKFTPLETATMRFRGTAPAPLSPEQRDTIGKDIFEKVKGAPAEVFKGAQKLGKKIAGKPTTPVEAQFGSGLDILEESEGKSVDEIKEGLFEQGLSTDEAENAIFQAIEDIERQTKSTSRTFGRGLAVVGEEALPLAVGVGAGLKAGALAGKAGQAALGASRAARATTFLGQRAIEGAVAETGFKLASIGELPTKEQVGISSAIDVVLGTAGVAVKNIAKSLVATRRVNAGLAEPVEAVLRDIPDKSKIDKFVNTAKESAEKIKEPESVFKLSADELKKNVNILKGKTREVGSSIGEIRKGLKGTPIEGADEILENFKSEIAERFDLEIVGGKIKKAKGSLKDVTGVEKDIASVLEDLTKMAKAKDVKAAQDIISNLDNKINFRRGELAGGADPLEGLLRSTRGEISGSIKATSPELATKLDEFSKLKRLEERLATQAGKDLQRSGLLFRRAALSSDKGFEAREALKDLAEITGNDLRDDAVLGRLVLEQFAPEQAKTLFERGQSIGRGLTFEGGKGGVLSLLTDLIPDISKADTDVLLKKLLADEKTAGQVFVDLLQGNTTRTVQTIRRLLEGEGE